MPQKKISLRKVILLFLNLASTLLTLLTGLRENPLLVAVTGRYDYVRSRFIDGSINYDIVARDLLAKDMLPDLAKIGKDYRFISAPRRSPSNLGTDRSTCVRVNTMNVTAISVHYDDFGGQGSRRLQVFMFSISAPSCRVINFWPDWYETTCVQEIGRGNATACHHHVFTHFDELLRDRRIQAAVAKDFGVPGVAFLKCSGRPEESFSYITDLMVQTSMWAGGDYDIEVQTSRCKAVPLVRDEFWQWGLFRVEASDQGADVVVAVDNTGWFPTIVTVLYGIVSVSLIILGILAAALRKRNVRYLPEAARFLKERWVLKYLFPFMQATTELAVDENRVITFKGTSFMASDVWMNHWLYIALSSLEAVVTIRTTYIVKGMGTWMLIQSANFENFLFLCSALTRITWLVCFIHTLLRFSCKFALRTLKSMRLVRPHIRDRIERYIDGSALFMNYKLYSILLCVILLIFLQTLGATTLMKRIPNAKQGVYGGDPQMEPFWSNEIILDTSTIVGFQLAMGLLIGCAMMHTRYRAVVENSVIRLLQDRYVLVGWDVFVTMEALGIDPYQESTMETGVARANCSLGALLQQLYTSGFSGHVHLAGDFLFLENGFSMDPPEMLYSIKYAAAIGLYQLQRGRGGTTAVTNKYFVPSSVATESDRHSVGGDSAAIDDTGTAHVVAPSRLHGSKSMFDRKLRLVSEGRFGRLLLIDEADPGRLIKTQTATVLQFQANEVLSQLTLMDIKPLLGNDKKLSFS